MTQIPVPTLEKLGSPFENDVWDCGIVSKQMVQDAIENNALLDHQAWAMLHLPTEERGLTATLEAITPEHHASRIAFLMKAGWTDPMEIDVGIPSMGCYPNWMWGDGNHRLAAAIMLELQTIDAEVAGDLDYATELFGVEFDDSEEASY